MVGGLLRQEAPAVLAFAAVVLATVAAALLLEWWLEWRRRREMVGQLRAFATAGSAPDSPTLLRTAGAVEARWLRVLAARVPHLRDIRRLLDQAGLQWTAQSYLVVTLGLALGMSAAAGLALRVWAAAFVAAAIGAWLPYLFVRSKRARRISQFEEQLPEVIDLIGRAIRAGHPLSAGLKMASDEAPEPIAGELLRVFEEQRFGMPFQDALLGLADRVDLTDVRILVTAILIQREVGGNLAEVLDKIAYTIRERFTIRRQVRVYTAQGRFSGYVLSVLPIAVGSALFFINREFIMLLFQDVIGRYLLVTAVALQILGYLWIRKIVQIEI